MGPLSGKTIITAIVYVAAWIVLHFAWRRSNPPLRRIVTISVLLMVLGLIGTFPKFFELFASD